MIVFQNESGAALEVRRAVQGGVIVEPGGIIELEAKIHEETDDAYIVARSVLVRVNNEMVDDVELTAWPKATWKKITKKAAEANEKDEEK